MTVDKFKSAATAVERDLLKTRLLEAEAVIAKCQAALDKHADWCGFRDPRPSSDYSYLQATNALREYARKGTS